MNISEYNTEFSNSIPYNFPSGILLGMNESSLPAYDYMYEKTDNHLNNNMNYSSGFHQLSSIIQQLFKMSDNRSNFDMPDDVSSGLSSSIAGLLLPSEFSIISTLPSSSNDASSYNLFSTIFLWFVLIFNPILILFGVIGNMLTIYILLNCNIVKLPVSFYTVMLNISDTLNLLIPVFIFWLDNCFNRTPERGYFRDKSNFLCKTLTCPDQLFAALSAWYMCAISFNRWLSICRPSSYFFRMSSYVSKASSDLIKNTVKKNTGKQKQDSPEPSNRTQNSSIWSYCSFDGFFCCSHHLKYRQHLQAFRSIAIITIFGILGCLFPIFMHEIRTIVPTNRGISDTSNSAVHTYAVVLKRCYYSQKNEYVYDIIGIILSTFLHILPLTFVAAMNIMIITRLRQRQNLMNVSSNRTKPSSNDSQKTTSTKQQISSNEIKRDFIKSASHSLLSNTNDEPMALTCLSNHTMPSKPSGTTVRFEGKQQRRHYSRDRTITMMLVSVALSYLLLTIPYRLFWSYNVYIKRMHPEKLTSALYLLKMHHIDHVLRTIRNIHYGTNFIFFILLSKSFRQNFQELLAGKFLRPSNRQFHATNSNYTNNICTSIRITNAKQSAANAEQQSQKSMRFATNKRITAIKMMHTRKLTIHQSLDCIPNISRESSESNMSKKMNASGNDLYGDDKN